ncbi:hypothetical protein PGT21_004303 [Puccinia graminis f. sp. tritici]|uniref:Uncharacterized protein n=1 Tax=Puccinia graminis f. sp. tritici TaxID=56615 RepID=A0A5B0M1P1_PUCGR|nr:hypothetical protein PGT21_004303 [Puccinia graminis f. sp. tritici]
MEQGSNGPYSPSFGGRYATSSEGLVLSSVPCPLRPSETRALGKASSPDHPLLPSFHSSRVIGSVLKCGRWDSHIPILVIGVARSLITDLQTPWDPIGIPSSLPSKSQQTPKKQEIRTASSEQIINQVEIRCKAEARGDTPFTYDYSPAITDLFIWLFVTYKLIWGKSSNPVRLQVTVPASSTGILISQISAINSSSKLESGPNSPNNSVKTILGLRHISGRLLIFVSSSVSPPNIIRSHHPSIHPCRRQDSVLPAVDLGLSQ